MSASTWTDARKALAKRLWTEGLSASAIADRMGGVTRNAVIGMLHREKLELPLDKLIAERKRQARVRGHGNRVARGNVRTSGGIAPSKSAPSLVSRPVAAKTNQPVAEPTSATNVPLLNLQYGMCRWPIGPPIERAVLFCGGPAEIGTSWCCAHAQRVFQAPVPRRGWPPVYQPKPTFEEA